MVDKSTAKSLGISCLVCLLFLVLLLVVGGPWIAGCLLSLSDNEHPICSAVYDGDLAKVKDFVKKEPKLVNYTYKGIKGEEYTVLTDAIRDGQLDIAKYLLEKGANPNKDEMEGSTLHFAAEKGDEELIRCLFKHGVIIEDGDLYLLTAIKNKNLRVCRVLRHYGANDVPLAFEAAARGDIELVKDELTKHPAVLKMKVDPVYKSEDDQGFNIVHFAVQSDKPEIIRMLAKRGADIDTSSAWKYTDDTPIAIACDQGNLPMVKVLVECGANLHWSDDAGVDNCLSNAVRELHIDVVRYLLDKGLNPNKNRATITSHLMRPDYNIDGSINTKSELEAMKIARLLVSRGFIPHKKTLEDAGSEPCKTADYLWQYAR